MLVGSPWIQSMGTCDSDPIMKRLRIQNQNAEQAQSLIHSELYWSELVDDNSQIVIGKMDGHLLHRVASTGPKHPTSSVFNADFGIYWVDPIQRTIEHSMYDGQTQPSVQFSDYKGFLPQHLAIYDGRLYWAGAGVEGYAIFIVDLRTKAEQYAKLNFSERVHGICTYDAKEVIESIRMNPCASSHSCLGVCLLSGRHFGQFVCPTGFEPLGSSCVGMTHIFQHFLTTEFYF